MMRAWIQGTAVLAALVVASTAVARTTADTNAFAERCEVYNVAQTAVTIGSPRSETVSIGALAGEGSIGKSLGNRLALDGPSYDRGPSRIDNGRLAGDEGLGVEQNCAVPALCSSYPRDCDHPAREARVRAGGGSVANGDDAPRAADGRSSLLAVGVDMSACARDEKTSKWCAQPAQSPTQLKSGGDDRLTRKTEGTQMIKAILMSAAALGSVAGASPALAGPEGITIKGGVTIKATQQGAFTAVATGVGSSATIDNARIDGKVNIGGDVKIEATQQGAFTAVATGVAATARISNGVISGK